MVWTQLSFGEHKGKTLPQVLFSDPDWFFWAMEKSVFENRPGLKREADIVNSKARRIRVPGSIPRLVEYVIHTQTGKFSHFDIVPFDRPPHEGSSPTIRSEVIDCSVPRQIKKFDKLGCKRLLKSLKRHVLGSTSIKMTKARCEMFFNDDQNFV